jgi:carboxymethylenebutenolidase
MKNKMDISSVIIETLDGNFSGYLSVPFKEGFSIPKGIILVVQEIFGVNQTMKKICDEFSKKGFIAFCPDLFWRLGDNIQLSDQSEDQLTQAFDLYKQFNFQKGMEDLGETQKELRKMFPDLKMAGVGYCLGGSLAYHMAYELPFDAVVSYYGIGLEDHLTHKQHAPLLLHIAEEDIFVSREAQKAISDHFLQESQTEIYIYEGACHAFARIDGKSWHPILSELANSRTYNFLSCHLV